MVVYCNAIFPQLVCSKIIYHLRIIATLCVRWSCSFFVTCPCPADCWQMRHPSKESPAFAHLSYGRYFLLSHYTFISDKQQQKKNVCMHVRNLYHSIRRVTKYTSSGKAISMTRPRSGKCTEYEYLPNIAVVGTVRQLIS